MSAPSGGEIAIYQSRATKLEYRLLVGMTEPQWTGPVSDTFSGSTLSNVHLMSSQIGGPPLVVDSGFWIQGYGGPPYEWVESKEEWFPTDTTKSFAIEADIVFVNTDPVYPQIFVVGGIDTGLGQMADIMVVQEGSAYNPAGNANIGATSFHAFGNDYIVPSEPWDGLTHTLRVEWDASTEVATIYWDAVELANSSAYNWVARPCYWQAGIFHPHRLDFASYTVELDPPARGTVVPPVPALLMGVYRVEVTENGDGYESATWPAWSDATRFTSDGITWAYFPNSHIKGIRAGGPSREDVPTCTLTLSADNGDSADLFQDEPWIGRIVAVDTRIANDAGSFTSWKRLGMYTITDLSLGNGELVLNGTNRVLNQLDYPLISSWLGVKSDSNADGEPDAILRNYTLLEILNDIIDLADAFAGGPLIPTIRHIEVPPFVPLSLSSPDVSILQWYMSLADRLVQEVWVKHTTSGSAQYGDFYTNLWNLGTNEVSGWTFYGRGGASPSNIEEGGLRLSITGKGPGQVFYRNDNPIDEEIPIGYGREALTRDIRNTPYLIQYPYGVSFPSHSGTLSDSSSELSRSFDSSADYPWPDADGNPHFGGVASFRYWQERASTRILEVNTTNMDCFEVADFFDVDDPLGLNIADEVWVISKVEYNIVNNVLKTAIKAETTDTRKSARYHA